MRERAQCPGGQTGSGEGRVCAKFMLNVIQLQRAECRSADRSDILVQLQALFLPSWAKHVRTHKGHVAVIA